MWEVGRESPYAVQAGLSYWSLLPSLASQVVWNTGLCLDYSLIKSNWKQVRQETYETKSVNIKLAS